jgi:hypothetical protein
MPSSSLLQGSEKIDKNSAGQNRIVWFAKPDSPVFPDRAKLNTKELDLQALIDISPHLSLSTKNCWGGLLEDSLIIIIFIFAFYYILRICQRSGVKMRRVRWRCSSHVTIVKAEAAKAHIAIPLLHQSFFIKAGNPFIKGLNFQVFFTLGSNGGTRGCKFKWVCISFTDLVIFLLSRLSCWAITSAACWDLHITNNKLKIFWIGDRGLSHGCPLPLAALEGEECGTAALESSTW